MDYDACDIASSSAENAPTTIPASQTSFGAQPGDGIYPPCSNFVSGFGPINCSVARGPLATADFGYPTAAGQARCGPRIDALAQHFFAPFESVQNVVENFSTITIAFPQHWL
jgi:hypothetical protein